MTLLGKITSYNEEYDPSVLEAIPRSAGRSQIKNLSLFEGFDIWRCYEFSWLNMAGMPQRKLLTFQYPSSNSHIVESKSLKIYLGGFAFKRFKDFEDCKQLIKNDLAKVLLTDTIEFEINYIPPQSKNIDSIEVLEPLFTYDKHLLKVSTHQVKDSVSTLLFRSLCPVTGQPDWATIYIEYVGGKIVEESILRYLFSLRRHQGFHEQCCELIYSDIIEMCCPSKLTVICDFTRRGGISITPVRSTKNN